MAKGEDFYWRGINKLPKRLEKCITSDVAYFEKSTIIILLNLACFLILKSAFQICTPGTVIHQSIIQFKDVSRTS